LKVTQLFNNKKQLFAAAPQKILNLNGTVNIVLSLLICLASLYHFSPKLSKFPLKNHDICARVSERGVALLYVIIDFDIKTTEKRAETRY